jgi:hypothetical protein
MSNRSSNKSDRFIYNCDNEIVGRIAPNGYIADDRLDRQRSLTETMEDLARVINTRSVSIAADAPDPDRADNAQT